MLTKKRIDQFYKEVDSLNLKFPVAALSKATGESKGNVSKYLSRKSDPSESFIEKFEKFYNGYKKDSGSVVAEDTVLYEVGTPLLKELTKEVKQLKATVYILKVTVAQLAATSAGKAISTMLVELDRAIDEEANRLFEEDKKNQLRV